MPVYKTLSTFEMIDDLLRDSYANWNLYQARELAEFINDNYYNYEWDVIGVRCEWGAFENKFALEKNYNLSIDTIKNETVVLEVEDGTYLVREF